MKLRSVLLTLFVCLLVAGTQAHAQWQTPNHTVPIGRGPGVTGFNNATPGAIGNCLTSNGASADPTFQACGGFITPQEYGAICDNATGHTGNLAAIQAAINAAVAQSKVLFITGICIYTGELFTNNGSGAIVIQGLGGTSSSVLAAETATQQMMTVNGNGPLIMDGVAFSSVPPKTGGYGIKIAPTSGQNTGTYIVNSQFLFQWNALQFDAAVAFIVRDSFVSNIPANAVSFRIQNTVNVDSGLGLIDNVAFSGDNVTGNGQTLILWLDGGSMRIINSQFLGGATQVRANFQSGASSGFLIYSNNQHDTPITRAVQINSVDATTGFTTIQMNDNVFNGAPTDSFIDIAPFAGSSFDVSMISGNVMFRQAASLATMIRVANVRYINIGPNQLYGAAMGGNCIDIASSVVNALVQNNVGTNCNVVNNSTTSLVSTPILGGSPKWVTSGALQLSSYGAGVLVSDGSGNITTGGATDGVILNVRAYGAKCDGSTDDTTALRAAILLSTNKPIVLPPNSNCVISNTLDFRGNGSGVIGFGPGSSRITMNSTSNIALVAGLDGAQAHNFSGFTLHRNGTAVSGANNLDISSQTQYDTVENMIIEGGYHGLVLGSTPYGWVRKVVIDGTVSDGLLMGDNAAVGNIQWQLDEILIANSGGHGALVQGIVSAATGADLGEWRSFQTFGNGGNGIRLQGVSGGGIGDGRFSNLFLGSDGHTTTADEMYIDTYGGTVLIQGSSWIEGSESAAAINVTATSGNVSLQGMTINFAKTSGIIFSNASWEVTGGNIQQSQAGDGIHALAGVGRIIGVHFDANSGSGVYIGASVTSATITSNDFTTQTTAITNAGSAPTVAIANLPSTANSGGSIAKNLYAGTVIGLGNTPTSCTGATVNICDTGSSNVGFSVGNSTDANGFNFSYAAADAYLYNLHTGGSMFLGTQNTTRLTIGPTGNVLMSAALNVVGTYSANGTVGVTCSSGISATTGRSVNGIITAC